jgi:3-oxoacyl-[acyl-carrier protein] reductase
VSDNAVLAAELMRSGPLSASLNGRHALVTGAARNIGAAIAVTLARHGCNVSAFYRRKSATTELLRELVEDAGVGFFGLSAELSDPDKITTGIRSASQANGHIDILVNNAATRPRARIGEISADDWDAVLNVNVRAPFLLAQAVLPAMREQGWGRIVNVSGLDAFWGEPQRAHVVASKGALIALTRALANETASWGVTVNAVVPGSIRTVRAGGEVTRAESEDFLSRVPIGRQGSIWDVAEACMYLASPVAGYVTGQTLLVTGGAFPSVRMPLKEDDMSQAGAWR